MKAQLFTVVLLMCCWFGKCLQRPASFVGPLAAPSNEDLGPQPSTVTDRCNQTEAIKTELRMFKMQTSAVKLQQRRLNDNLKAKQASLEALQNLMVTQLQCQTSERNDLKKQVADLQQQFIEQETACNTNQVATCKKDYEDNIRNTTATLERKINAVSQQQLSQGHQIKQQTNVLNKLSEQKIKQDNETSAQWKHMVAVHKQLKMELNNLEKHLNLTHEMLVNETANNNEGFEFGGNCSDIKGFKKGQVLSHRGSVQGAFGRDQLSKTGAFYSMDGYSNVRILNLYPSEADFIKNTNATSYTLPMGCQGAQTQMIGGKLFCPQYPALTVLVYDLADLSTPYKEIKITTGSSDGHKCQYGWLGGSTIDIEVDETWTYIIWANANQNCNFVISRVDPITLDIDRNWQTPITKKSKGNAFMVCGKLYVTNSYTDKNSFVSHVFDMHNNGIVNPDIYITYRNEYNYAAHTHYDPRDKVLYVWDRRHQLKVGIVWK